MDAEVTALNPEVKAKAEALAAAIKASEEYKAFQSAREELDKHEAAKIMLRDFTRKQLALQQKMMRGEAPTEAEIQSLQQAYQLVTFNPYVRKVVEAELAFSEMLAGVQEILAEAVGVDALLGAEGEQAGPGGAAPGKKPDDGGSARSKLWVPGR